MSYRQIMFLDFYSLQNPVFCFVFFFQAEDGIRDIGVTGVPTCALPISVAPAIGPTVSGLILQYLSWRFMFVFVLPIALVALVVGARLIGDVGEPGRQRLDLVSVLLSDREGVVEGKGVDLGGRRVIKQNR